MTSAIPSLLRATIVTSAIVGVLAVAPAHAQTIANDTVRVHLNDVDVRSAIQLLGQYLDRPVVVGTIPNARITIETPQAVPRSQILGLLRATLESHNLELIADSVGPYRVRQRAAERPSQPRPSAPAEGTGQVELYTLRLRHARASDVAATVNALYGRVSAFGEQAAPTSPTLTQELRQNVLPPTVPGMPPQPVPVIGNGRSATLAGETTIVPDPSSNSLLIRASRSDYELIAAAVKELDVRPLQVLIEVLIAEVRRDRSLNLGVDVSVPPTTINSRTGLSAEGQQVGLGNGLGDLVFRVMGLGGDADAHATLRAAATRGEVTILSRPAVLAVNNERAEIIVGSQRPFVQVSRSLPTDAPSRDQVVQYKDVGTKLSVQPTISADGYIMLQVTQEVSAATTETAFDAPVISTRSVQTKLLLRDGQTVVIGGLTDQQKDVTKAGVPVLSSIPVIGWLFGRTTRRTLQTELFLFITPKVVANDGDADRVTGVAQQKAKVPVTAPDTVPTSEKTP